MAERKQLIVFCYDISRPATRTRISTILEKVGVRVQYSVFECRMTASRAARLFRRLEIARDGDDNIRMYVIPEDARLACRAAGGAPIAEKHEYWLL